MIKFLSNLYEEEDNKLAPYAIKNSESAERTYPEEEHPYRLPFHRDRDRIYHSRSFKRLEYKTQVFINSEGDHFRTRLTHTLEVAGVSRTVATALGLNPHLSECIALAHDIGHPPFGHAGQDILHELMKNYGGFEHNKQSLRVVQKLENRYPEFHGLNLTMHTLRGIMKHGGDYEKSDLNSIRLEHGPSLEALITDYSDEIAYTNHDIEDGLEKKYITISGLMNVRIWKDNYIPISEQYNSMGQDLVIRKTIRAILNHMVTDLIYTTNSNLEKHRIKDRETLFHAWKERKEIVYHSSEIYPRIKELKKYLYENLYNHEKVLAMSMKGQQIIEKLFFHFCKNPMSVPDSYNKRISEEGVERVVADYISGMTDRYAELKYNELL